MENKEIQMREEIDKIINNFVKSANIKISNGVTEEELKSFNLLLEALWDEPWDDENQQSFAE